MSAPARQVELLDPHAPATGEEIVDLRALKLAVRCAAVVSRPLVYLDHAYCGLEPLPPVVVRQAARVAPFAAPLNRAVSRNLKLDELPFEKDFLIRLSRQARSRLAALIVSAGPQEIGQAAIVCASAVLHRVIVGLVLKSQRAMIREALGEATFQMSIREVPMLYASLGDLPLSTQAWSVSGEGSASELQLALRNFGLQVLCTWLDVVEPVLATLFELRFPPEVGLADRAKTVARPLEIQTDQLMKLLRRRMQGWTDIIG